MHPLSEPLEVDRLLLEGAISRRSPCSPGVPESTFTSVIHSGRPPSERSPHPIHAWSSHGRPSIRFPSARAEPDSFIAIQGLHSTVQPLPTWLTTCSRVQAHLPQVNPVQRLEPSNLEASQPRRLQQLDNVCNTSPQLDHICNRCSTQTLRPALQQPTVFTRIRLHLPHSTCSGRHQKSNRFHCESNRFWSTWIDSSCSDRPQPAPLAPRRAALRRSAGFS